MPTISMPTNSMPRRRQHPRARSSERGAAVFIVMMAIMLLTSLGVFALYSAGFASRAAGFQRMSAQTLYTAELGILSGTGYFSVPGFAQVNYAVAEQGTDDCDSVPADTFCKRIWMEDIETTTTNTILELTAAEGSLGPFPAGDPAALEANFILEMSDPRPVDVAGSEAGGGEYRRVTLTSYGIVRPVPASGQLCTNADGANKLTGRLGMRAHVVIGPVR